jgi:hypothetical protein
MVASQLPQVEWIAHADRPNLIAITVIEELACLADQGTGAGNSTEGDVLALPARSTTKGVMGMSESFTALHAYVAAVACPNSWTEPSESMLIPTPAHGVARMTAPAADEPSSNESAGPQDRSPAAARQLRLMEILGPDRRPAGRTRRAGHTSARLFQLASMFVTATLPAQSAPLAQFDGRWSILVITDRGDCSIYRYGVIVDQGHARYAGTADFSIDGSITSSGLVRASISRGSDHAHVQGRLGRGTGFGRWSIAGGYDCSGHWTAERRDADPELAAGEE